MTHYPISLKKYNTFGIDAYAKHLVEANTEEDIIAFFENKPKNKEFLILNGGSNILITKNIDAWILKINLKGIEIVEENDNEVVVRVLAGENWHDFVLHSIENNWGGLENLSLIPGNVGSCPIQNIGAYGVEVKDVITTVESLNIYTLQKHIFTNEDCKFGYRDSIFKNEQKGKFVLTAVSFRLKKAPHQLKTSYGVIESELQKNNISQPTIKDISNAVIAIRNSKLPNPREIGNGGSFFKNPVIGKERFEQFIAQNPEAPHYIVDKLHIKIPAGWLIEQAGMKGYRKGDAGVHTKQALVLVNYGNATGNDILEVAYEVQNRVFEKFQITIEPEVNII
ncbi:UDP-N-acetylmuramate dehydrogenase [Capnocytophaga sp. ARDL2]|uniref:UDP-N-acetylmuramate dehydrogenase n=1 Tax=Capnocytophaga sp. ARDL2 TaxID=3238809 RepID=UPI003557BC55